MDRSVNCWIFGHRCFLGRPAKRWDSAVTVGFSRFREQQKRRDFSTGTRDRNPPKKRPLTIQCIFPLFEVQGGYPAPGQMACLSFLKHMNTCSILFYHILFDGFCPGKPMILGRQEDCVCAQMREQACSCPDGLAEHPSSTSNNVGC